MTVIVGLAQKGVVYIGADSAAVSGYTNQVTALRKVFQVGEFLIGYTSSFRMGQILQYHLEVRQQQDGESDERYMVVAFIEAVRECLKSKGYARIDNNEETGGVFLVGYRGNIYEISSDFQVNHYDGGVAACGAGDSFALAVLLALKASPPMERIQRALEIASDLSPYVAPPFHIMRMESPHIETVATPSPNGKVQAKR